ncbi:cysteine peptidase family C39 domain-containing protein [Sediminitomix flava]|uniref:Uncharacterized protein n=1 Tax=Sediminitomix flava TaxID=379075 RepID=A0A315YXX2_SEDFL|nr:hypothetical protein [Sediminitomix flava]PWJ34152.1 hypothetical protein BC781_11162 [Sediminitomix flava]
MKNKLSTFLLLTFLGSCNPATFFQQRYYKDSYQPISMESQTVLEDSATIKGMHCISYSTAYCQSACLQMIHSLYGDIEDISYYNWAMGFTYGAYYQEYAGVYSFLPYSDPETGLIQAESVLGYKKNYLISHDKDVFISNIKAHLIKNQPVKVGVNSAILENRKGFYPHSIILIGYTSEYVKYYETGGSDRILFQYEGEKVKWDRLISAITSFSQGFNYPWEYQLTVFDKTSSQNLITTHLSASIIQENAKSVIGASYGSTHLGSHAFIELANRIEQKDLTTDESSYLLKSLSFGQLTREDNAVYMLSDKMHTFNFTEIAVLYKQSAVEFKKSQNALEKGNFKSCAKALREIGRIENKIGEKLSQILEI